MVTPSLRDEIWRLPGALRFLDALSADVGRRRSAAAAVPGWLPDHVLAARLRERLEDDGHWVAEVPAIELGDEDAAALEVARELGYEWPAGAPHTLDTLVAATEMPPVVLLTGLADLSVRSRARWMTLIGDWGACAKEVADAGGDPNSLVAVAAACAVSDGLPRADTHLAVHCLWGFPDALEGPVLCRLAVNGSDGSLAQRWREQVLAPLAGDDVRLMEVLWGPITGSLDDVVHALRRYAEERGWTVAELRSLALGEAARDLRPGSQSLPALPPDRLMRAWSTGAIATSIDRGVEMHPAALALLDRSDELRHRLWRGQVRMLLPVIDTVRLKACMEITDQMGETWPLDFEPPEGYAEREALRESPLNCQFGQLQHLLFDRAEFGRWRPRWGELVRDARRLRNKLAHCQPVEFQDYKGLVTKAQQKGVLSGVLL